MFSVGKSFMLYIIGNDRYKPNTTIFPSGMIVPGNASTEFFCFLGRKKVVSTNPTDPIFVPTLNICWCSSMILEEKYDFRYEKGIFTL